MLHRFIYLWTLLKWGMGLPLALLVSLGVLCAIVWIKRNREHSSLLQKEKAIGKFATAEVLLLTFIIPYLLFIGIHKVKFARHLLILYPALTLLAAAALTRVPSIVNSLHSTERLNIFGKWFGTVLGGVVALYSLVYTLSFAAIFFSQPTKVAASEWITEHIPQEDAIAIAPEILFDWLLPELDFVVTDEQVKWVLIVMPDYEVFRKYEKASHRYRDEDWYPLSEIEFEETLAFYERVLGEGSPYQLHKTFRCPPKFFGLEIISDSGAPFPMRALAHPELRVYRRLN